MEHLKAYGERIKYIVDSGVYIGKTFALAGGMLIGASLVREDLKGMLVGVSAAASGYFLDHRRDFPRNASGGSPLEAKLKE